MARKPSPAQVRILSVIATADKGGMTPDMIRSQHFRRFQQGFTRATTKTLVKRGWITTVKSVPDQYQRPRSGRGGTGGMETVHTEIHWVVLTPKGRADLAKAQAQSETRRSLEAAFGLEVVE